MIDDGLIHEIKNKFPFIKNLKDKNKLDNFMKIIKIIKLKSGEKLLEEGDHCTDIVFVINGVVRVYKLSPEGKEITLYRLYDGETCVLNVASIMSNTPYPATAEAEQEVLVGLIPVSFYNDLFFTEPSFQQFIFNTVSTRFQEVILLIDEIVFKNVNLRLAKFILKKSAENGQKGNLEITHEKIAAELGTAREVISRILKDFEKENIVTLLRGKIIIKNEEKLKRIAEM